MEDSDHKINILFTRDLDDFQINLSKKYSIEVNAIPFISVILADPDEILRLLPHGRKINSILFTSQHAVNAVTPLLLSGKICIPERFYCVGQKTAEPLKNAGYKVLTPLISDMQGIKNLIQELSEEQNIIYFRGNLGKHISSKDFPLKNINFFETIVYKTILIKKNIDTNFYHGIVFQSPSAVKAFFDSPNTVNDEIILFTGGRTTANEIVKYSKNKLIISEKPEIEYLFLTINNFFKNKNELSF
jgi:uroporphyrinogen-III synthase